LYGNALKNQRKVIEVQEREKILKYHGDVEARKIRKEENNKDNRKICKCNARRVLL